MVEEIKMLESIPVAKPTEPAVEKVPESTEKIPEKTREQIIQEELGLKKKDVEAIVGEQTKTSLLRDGVLYLKNIWENLQLLTLIAAACMLIWCGGKVATIDWSKALGMQDIMQAIVLAFASVIFTRLGFELPASGKLKQAKEWVEKTILRK